MQYHTSYLWEQGSRKVNEDSLAILSLIIDNRPLLLAVVADGIGGLSQGEEASSFITRSLRCRLETRSRQYPPLTLNTLRTTLLQELYRCHHRLLSYSHRENIQLGTTCSLVCLLGSRGFYLHTGDSRIYLNDRQITIDHTDHKGRLYRAIGIGSYHRPDYGRLRLHRGDYLRLSTDGHYTIGSTDNSTAIYITTTQEDI